ncbi:MAG: flagellar basal body P-ring protein FlgI [Sulfuricella sp.]|nr:flagellar basal body P-ring protein FlgI [Sulfuricella sp.]
MAKFAKTLAFLAAALLAMPVQADRIKDLANIQGVRNNQLVGYGIVVGLDGSGDQTTQTPFTVQSIISMLGQLGVNLPAGTSLQLKNVAAVTVTAVLPPFAKPGQTIDVTVSSIGNAKSLRGGTLVMTPLKGADGQVYGMAQGNLMVGGVGASAGGASVQVNQLSVGRITDGATVERAVETSLGQGDYITLELKDSDYTTASRVVTSVNRSFGEGTANAENGRVIRVLAPRDSNLRVSFLARMENLSVVPGEMLAKVIMNARTGSIVMNKSVMIDACAVAHGSLTVTISSDPMVSQPAPFSGGETVVVQKTQIDIKAEKGGLVPLPKSASLNDVVKALNAVGATPQDLLAILQAMKAAGALRADLEVI